MSRYLTIATVVALVAPAVAGNQIRRETLDGVRNFTRPDATVGCAGATGPEAMAGLARLGFKAVVNLRLASENGAAIDESKAAAEAARLKYIHLPFNGAEPDPKVIDQFILTVTDPQNQPVFVHCGSANRVGAVWLAKRMVVDRWDEARALEEAKAIGLSSEALQKFALDYVAKRRGGER